MKERSGAGISFFFFPVSWYTIRQVHSSTEFPELTVCLVPGTGGIEWSPPNQVFWLVIRQKKNPASKCYKNKAARLLPFQRVGLSEKRVMLACVYMRSAKTWQVSFVEITRVSRKI